MDHYFTKSHLLLTISLKEFFTMPFASFVSYSTAKLGGFQHQHVLSHTVGWES